MTDSWTDRIVGDRMAVDQEFTDRVTSSQFTSQQWGLIMTAIEFEIENPGDESAARIVADTSNLPAIIPELEKMEGQGPMGRGASPGQGSSGGGGSGLLGGLADKLLGGGSGGGVDEQQVEAAEQLVQEYATQLQEHLEEREKWADVRAVAAGEAE